MPISKLSADPGWMGDPRRGASIGRPGNPGAGDPGAPVRLYLARVPLDWGGYDSGGAYWGDGVPLYRYESAGRERFGFLRAPDRAAAKLQLGERFPAVSFFH